MKFHTFLLASIAVVSPAFAQTADSQKTQTTEPPRPVYSTVLPVHIQPRQAGADSISKAGPEIEQANQVNPDLLGLYTRVSEGGLGDNLWKDYSSAQIVDDLSKINLNFYSPAMLSLLKRALLTTPNPQDFADDKNGDVFSLRLRNLADIGAFEETAALYNKLEGNIPSAKAASAGAESIFSMGQMGVACLEEKAVTPAFKEASSPSFWSDLHNFCGLLLSKFDKNIGIDDAEQMSQLFVTNKKLPAANVKELNGKSVIEVFALERSGLVSESYTPANIRNLKLEYIALLLKRGRQQNVSNNLSLLSVAAEKGLVNQTDFTQAFTRAAVDAAQSTGYWTPYLTAFNKIQNATETEKTSQLKSVLDKAPLQGSEILPFAASLTSVKNADAFTPVEARKVVSVLIRSKVNVSGVWAARAFGRDDLKAKESVTDVEVISSMQSAKAETDPSNPTKDDKAMKQVLKKPETIENPQLYVLFLTLQEKEAEDKPSQKSYEKLLSLTAPNDYVMPSKELMKNLTESATRQDTGKIIIYSLQILNGQRISQIHPAALFRISEGLQSVGLSEENRNLAHEVLADLIEEYKN